jgi:hypothetical protein
MTYKTEIPKCDHRRDSIETDDRHGRRRARHEVADPVEVVLIGQEARRARIEGRGFGEDEARRTPRFDLASGSESAPSPD